MAVERRFGPTSAKQIAANRRNAKRSTGPRTAAGKARSSRNAVRHGLRSSGLIPDAAEAADYDVWAAELVADLRPVGPLETGLARQVALALWRLQKSGAAEAAMLATAAEEIAVQAPGDGTNGHVRLLVENRSFVNMPRYETALARAFDRALGDFNNAVRDRQRGHVPELIS